MTQLLAPFDAMQYDPTQSSGGSFPIGKHPVIINGSEIKSVKDNTGGYLELTLEVIDGPAKGQTGAYRLNLYNQSEQAKQIAHKQMSALCHVVGVYRVDNAQALYNRPFVIEVGLQKGAEAAEKGYTEIKKVYDMAGNEPNKTGQAGGAAAAAQPQPAAAFQGAPQAAPAAAPAAQWAPAAQPAPAAAAAPAGSWQAPAAGQAAPTAAPWGAK